VASIQRKHNRRILSERQILATCFTVQFKLLEDIRVGPISFPGSSLHAAESSRLRDLLRNPNPIDCISESARQSSCKASEKRPIAIFLLLIAGCTLIDPAFPDELLSVPDFQSRVEKEEANLKIHTTAFCGPELQNADDCGEMRTGRRSFAPDCSTGPTDDSSPRKRGQFCLEENLRRLRTGYLTNTR
jgi:hypothetical protein